MNQLTSFRLLHYLWRVGGLGAIERRRQQLPHPYWVSRPLFGARFAVDASASLTQSLLYLWGERLIAERGLIKGLLSPGMHAVDVGANVGYYLLLLQQSVGRHGKVTLVEPSRENLPALERNIKLNAYANVVLHPVAVGESEGRVGLRAGINSGVTQIESGAYQVDVKPLDSIVTEKVDFLKIDVEGFEGQVLKGAQRVLERDHPVIFLELHPHILPRFGYSITEIIAQIRDIYGDSLEYYRDVTRDLPIVARLATRYQLINPVLRFEDPIAAVAHLPRDETGTIWCVAGRKTRT